MDSTDTFLEYVERRLRFITMTQAHKDMWREAAGLIDHLLAEVGWLQGQVDVKDVSLEPLDLTLRKDQWEEAAHFTADLSGTPIPLEGLPPEGDDPPA